MTKSKVKSKGTTKTQSISSSKTLVDDEPYYHVFHQPTFTLVRQVPTTSSFECLVQQAKEALDLDIAYRTLVLEQIIHQSTTRLLHLTEEEKRQQLSGIRLLIHTQWLIDHWHNLPIIVEDNIHFRLQMLVNSRFTLLGKHHVFIIDQKCTVQQMELEFQGLCWMEKEWFDSSFSTCIIVHKVSYIRYVCIHYGIYFYTLLKEQKEIVEYIQDISSKQLTVMTSEFGPINLPSSSDIRNVPSQTFMIAYWSYVDDKMWYYNRDTVDNMFFK
jgi:hypothetical protein